MSEAHEARLLGERARTSRLIVQLEGDFDSIVEASMAVATDDEHDPDGATIGYERARADALLAMARAQLAELDLALERVREGSYGSCQGCGRAIGDERLSAQPAAVLCVACAAPRVRPLRRR